MQDLRAAQKLSDYGSVYPMCSFKELPQSCEPSAPLFDARLQTA